MMTFIALAFLGAATAGFSAFRLREMWVARHVNVWGTIWPRSERPLGYWYWVSLMLFFSLAGAVFSAICLYVLVFHDFGS